MRVNHVGEKVVTSQGFEVTIIDYKNSKEFTIQFNDRYNTIQVYKGGLYRFKQALFENPNVFCLFKRGIAYKDDVKHNQKAFQKYRAMFDRCYGNQKGNNSAYIGCSVCEEWFDFSKFCEWFNENYYELEGEKIELDKDILVRNNRVYSPRTCVFVPHKINSIISQLNYHIPNKDLPIGVTHHITKYGKHRYRVTKLPKGQLFDDVNEAFQAYKEYTENEMKAIADKYKNRIPKNLYETLYNFSVIPY